MGFADLAESTWQLVMGVGVLAAAAGSSSGVRMLTQAELVMVFTLFIFGLVLKHESQIAKLEGGKKAPAKKKK